jgi:hypothetical protein
MGSHKSFSSVSADYKSELLSDLVLQVADSMDAINNELDDNVDSRIRKVN